MKTTIKFFLLVSVIALTTSCSSVFTASMTGQIVESDNTNNAVANATIMYYTSEKKVDTDVDLFYASTLSDPTDSMVNCIGKTNSANDGSFQFNNIIWNELFADYGKDGDIKTVYFLFYHKNYGLTRSSAKIVSNGTNRLGLFKISLNLNHAVVKGRIVNTTSRAKPVAGATVTIRIPTDWSYAAGDTNGTNFSSAVWVDSADNRFTGTTDDYGYFSIDISFRKKPDDQNNKGTVPARLSYGANNYSTFWIYDPADDPAIGNSQEISQSGIDHDGNAGTPTVIWTLSDPKLVAPTTFTDINQNGINDVFYPLTLRNATTASLDQDDADYFGLKQTDFTTNVSGRYYDGANYANGTDIWLFISDETGANDVSTNGRAPDSTDITTRVYLNNAGTPDDYEDGRFAFNNINWRDFHYNGVRSTKSVVIAVPDPADLAAQTIQGGNLDLTNTFLLKGDGPNVVTVQ